MPLAPGTRLGPYEIVAPAGAGGAQDGVSYLVTEYLEGETLADRLRRGPLPLEQVFRHSAEVSDGLERALRTTSLPMASAS